MARTTVSIVLRLTEAERDAIDRALPPDVMRTWWIRGAIRQRLERDGERAATIEQRSPPEQLAAGETTALARGPGASALAYDPTLDPCDGS